MKMSTIFIRPLTASAFIPSAFPVSKPTKFQERSQIFAKNLGTCGEFRCRKAVSRDNRRSQRIMRGFNFVRASASDEIERIPVFEQEASVEESFGYGGAGLEATLNNLSKWLVASIFTAILIWRHDAEALWAAMGSAINALLSITLKQILNQERPNSTLRSDPGMPSSHAQSITYTTTFLILSIVEWYGINVLTTTFGGVLIVLGSYFTWLRVSQNLHTVSQVVVGAIIGSTFSFLWFWAWNAYVLNLFVSTLWVRILVVLGASGFILGFVNHSYRSWIMEEDR